MTTHSFKVNDRVKVIDASARYMNRTGCIKVIEPNVSLPYCLAHIKFDDDGITAGLYFYRLELIDDDYTKRLEYAMKYL